MALIVCMYGYNCTISCITCKDYNCDPTSGACLYGCHKKWAGNKCDECKPGVWGEVCTEDCEHDCVGGCDRNTGKCIACQVGSSGNNCDTSCVTCRDDSCDPSTGECLLGCHDNWAGNKCDECKPGKWGEVCTEDCPQNCVGGCDRSTGGCAEKEQDEEETDKENEENITNGVNNIVITLSCIIAIVVIFSLIIIAVCIYHKQKMNQLHPQSVNMSSNAEPNNTESAGRYGYSCNIGEPADHGNIGEPEDHTCSSSHHPINTPTNYGRCEKPDLVTRGQPIAPPPRPPSYSSMDGPPPSYDDLNIWTLPGVT